VFCIEILEIIETLDCVLSKRATRPYIYDSPSTNAYVLIHTLSNSYTCGLSARSILIV
jgi:hypothetical protein